MKKIIILLSILLILVVSLGSFVLAGESSGTGEIKDPGINFEGAIQCGALTYSNYLDVKVEESYWNNYCGDKGFNPLLDGKIKAEKLCEKYETQEKIAKEYDSIKCPKRCPVKKLLNKPPFDSFNYCISGLIYGSTINCQSKIKFECAEEKKSPTPTPIPPSIPEASEIKSEIKFSNSICGQNSISGKAEENYWFKNFCRFERKDWVPKEKGGSDLKAWERYGFDPSKDGESRATNLCTKSRMTEKLFEKYNSINCPENCPIKEKQSIFPATAYCSPGAFTGSTIHCWNNLFFYCNESPLPESTEKKPPETIGWRPPIKDIQHGIVETNWLKTPGKLPETIGWRPPIKDMQHGIAESNWFTVTPTPKPSQTPKPPGVTPTPGQTPTPSPSPTPSKSPSPTPCRPEHFADEIKDAMDDAKKHFDGMEDSKEFIKNLLPRILRKEIIDNFCKNPNMDLTEFMNFHISEACDAVNTGSPRCREKMGKVKAKCDERFWKELGLDNLCMGGRSKAQLQKITDNCIDFWEKIKDDLMSEMYVVLREKCPPKEPTRIPIPEPTPTRIREATPIPPPSCPPDMIKVGENKCACPEGKVMVDKSCKTCEEATPAGYSTQKPNNEAKIMAVLGKERCVSGARITLPGRMQRGPCMYYSTGEPKIEVDRTPPICQSPCGPVQCDTSRSCPCPGKPNCTLRVTCNWDGWQRAGENQYIPKIAFR